MLLVFTLLSKLFSVHTKYNFCLIIKQRTNFATTIISKIRLYFVKSLRSWQFANLTTWTVSFFTFCTSNICGLFDIVNHCKQNKTSNGISMHQVFYFSLFTEFGFLIRWHFLLLDKPIILRRFSELDMFRSQLKQFKIIDIDLGVIWCRKLLSILIIKFYLQFEKSNHRAFK